MDDPVQNPVPSQTDPLRASLTNDTPSPQEPPAEPAVPTGEPYTPAPPPETTPPPETPPLTPDVPTPPQESLTADQYQATPWAQQPAPNYEQTPAYQQTPDQTATSAPPPAPEAPKSSSPKGFIIGGLLALIIVAAVFGAMTFLNKNSTSDIAIPPETKVATPKPAAPQQTTAPLTTTAPNAPTPTPKTAEVYTNSTYKYQFEYPLGLAAPLKTAPDAARFPSALETIKLNLYADPTSSVAAYVTVWAKVESVPKYITDGQSQFVKVNQYTTNRFTVKKPNNIEETHYLTQKFNNIYDIMLENPSGRISDPVFEKFLNSFTFLEDQSAQPTTAPAKTSSPSATLKPTK